MITIVLVRSLAGAFVIGGIGLFLGIGFSWCFVVRDLGI